MVFQHDVFRPAFGPVGQRHLQRPEHRHRARRDIAQVLAHAVLQKRQIHHGVRLADARALDEIPHGLGRVAPAAHAGQRGHARVVPAGDVALFDQPAQIALAHDRAREVQARKLNLAGRVFKPADADDPVVQRPVVLVLQRAEGMRDALQRVADGMGKIIHRVNAPGLAGAVVLLVQDAVEHRVAHVDVGRSHVDFRPEHIAAFRVPARAHFLEQAQAFLRGAVAPGRILARLRQGAAVFAHLLLRQLVHVRKAAANQVHGVLIALFVVFRCEEQPAVPGKAQPADVVHDAFDELRFLLGGVGIVKAEVAQPAIALRGDEIDVHGLGVADVQVAVGFRREAGMHPSAVLAGADVLVDKVPDKIASQRFGVFHGKSSLSALHNMMIV